jgi:hypothetical protein
LIFFEFIDNDSKTLDESVPLNLSFSGRVYEKMMKTPVSIGFDAGFFVFTGAKEN